MQQVKRLKCKNCQNIVEVLEGILAIKVEFCDVCGGGEFEEV
jgi:hypothetical protein